MQALLIALVGRADGADIDVHGPLSACQLESTGEAALCGSIAAPERAEVAGAREISLRVVVLPARREPRRDPLVYLAGGPGASAVAAASWIGQSFAALRETRDILLVDLRGTGGSGALDCADRKGPAGVQQILDEFFPRRLVERCRDELATRADLAAYDTTAAVEDLERVRARLGYVELNLFGESYGTRVAQVYLARHPYSIRTITLMGTLALGEPLPAEMARDGQAALSAQFAACASDPDCARAFPDLSEDLARALDRLDRTPVMIPLNGAAPPSPGELRLTREGFAQLLRYLLYVPLTAADVPLIVHEAAAGDYATFAGWAARLAPFLTSVADGFFLSVTCSEDLPFVSSETLDRAGEGTFLGDLRARSQRRACEVWPVRRAAADFQTPVAGDVPVLLITGERDPVTPPRGAERAATRLTHALKLIVRGGGHGFVGMRNETCPHDIATRFIESGKLDGLDTTCLAEMQPPPFRLPAVR